MVSLSAVGDIMLGRGVAETISRNGTFFPFTKIDALLRESDVVFANLETPLSGRGQPYSGKDANLTFRSDPSVVSGLKQAGINLVSLANNHITDYGEQGLLDTFEVLDALGIKHVGAGRNLNEAVKPVVFEREGTSVAFLGFNAYLPFCRVASKRSAGVAPFELGLMRETIKQAKSIADVVVVSVHWGIDYEECPIPLQKNTALKLIDFGASCILGHHPHVVQGIESYKNGLIVFSLGNFLFDEPFEETKDSFVFRCILKKSGIPEYEIIPTYINPSFQCEVSDGVRKEEMLKRIDSLTSYCWFQEPKEQRSIDDRWIALNLRSLTRTGNYRQFLLILGFRGIITKLPLISARKIINRCKKLLKRERDNV